MYSRRNLPEPMDSASSETPLGYVNTYASVFNSTNHNSDSSYSLPTALQNHTTSHPLFMDLNTTSSSRNMFCPDVVPESFSLFQASNAPYLASELAVALLATIGNALTIFVFLKDPKIRRLSNYYILSLSAADFLVGVLGIPLAILTSLGIPEAKSPCLLVLCTLIVLCHSSIFSLVGVTVDRYLAILHPLFYNRVMSPTKAIWIIALCWMLGLLSGLLPAFGWHQDCHLCLFMGHMDPNYLVFVYFTSIIAPGLLMAFCYSRIYCVILRRNHQANRGEVQAASKLSFIVLFFLLCWFPLYTLNCTIAFCPTCTIPLPLIEVTIILSHANSAINPFLYAYHIKDFRVAMKSLVCHVFSCGLNAAKNNVKGEQRQANGLESPPLSATSHVAEKHTLDTGSESHPSQTTETSLHTSYSNPALE